MEVYLWAQSSVGANAVGLAFAVYLQTVGNEKRRADKKARKNAELLLRQLQKKEPFEGPSGIDPHTNRYGWHVHDLVGALRMMTKEEQAAAFTTLPEKEIAALESLSEDERARAPRGQSARIPRG